MLPNPKYHIITYGCQMNKSDSERIAGILAEFGIVETENPREADIVLINTCSVRQRAEDRVYGAVRNLAKLRAGRPHLLIGVTGCMIGRDKDGQIKSRLGGADIIFDIKNLTRLPNEIDKHFKKYGIRLRNMDENEREKIDYLGIKPKSSQWFRGYVVIQTGCSNYCSYCVVPFARGHEKNRGVADILLETREMAKNGVKDIILLGQTVNSYTAPEELEFSVNNPFISKSKTTNPDTKLDTAVANLVQGKDVKSCENSDDFAALLWEINQIEGINRVSFASAHPKHITEKLIDALGLPKMMHHLHLPVQSGNNFILRKMCREYTREHYFGVIKKIKTAHPSITLATDIIVGFSGETEEHFQDTVDLYKEADYDLSYNAIYSPRSGTTAYKAYSNDVPMQEKKRRWRVLQDLMEKNALTKNKKYVGEVVEVLVDGISKGSCYGMSREYKRVIFSGDEKMIGQIFNVKIIKVKEWEMEGGIVD